ncbi:MAG: hypothetical protein RBT80_14235 [Candidatus Vecturithrix sp.]|nr:hypothetical protein [Candidatus Vecturithrix sp.]
MSRTMKPLNFMTSAGVGCPTTGIALGFLLVFPFRKDDQPTPR